MPGSGQLTRLSLGRISPLPPASSTGVSSLHDLPGPHPGNTLKKRKLPGQQDHESEHDFLHHAMFLHSGVVAVRRHVAPYFWGYYRGGARGRWQRKRPKY